MTFLVLAFPHGCYQATPWGGPAGDIEMPPSPWRLLRALYATWRTRLPGLSEETVHGLLGALAAPPRFYVPPHVIRDGAALLERDAELVAEWPHCLAPRQQDALTQLAAAIPYFGRTESCCRGSTPGTWAPDGHERWEPLDVAESIGPGRAISVLAPSLPLDIQTLLHTPAEVVRAGLPYPIGTRLLAYQWVPRIPDGPVNTVCLRFAGKLPPATHTVPVTDLLRRAALRRLDGIRGHRGDSLLAGRSADTSVIHDQHAHTSFLPILSEGLVSGVLAWTPAGLSADEIKAMTTLRWLSSDRLEGRVRLVGSVNGNIATLAPSLVGPARIWQSATPYIPSRYRKKEEWGDFLAADIRRECAYRNLPEPSSLEIVRHGVSGWMCYRTPTGPHSPQGRSPRPGAFLRIEFADPMRGPLALGHLSHYGLGLFTPECTS